MNRKRKIGILLSLAVVIIATYLLLSGSPLLTWSVDKADTMPLGNFITWFGIIALQTALFYSMGELHKPKTSLAKWFSFVMTGFIFLAILWFPICFLLAGNWTFSFSEKATFQGGQMAYQIFWQFTLFMVLAPLIAGIVYKLLAFFVRLRKEGS